MKFARILLAAIVGGIIMFMWGFCVHELLPIGKAGIKSLPAETTLLPAMKDAIHEPGFYFFPGMEAKLSADEWKAYVEKYKTSPAGILIYKPVGGEKNMPKLLGFELGSNIAAAFFAATLIAVTGGARRGIPVGLFMGLFAWLSIDVSYWNWYNFTTPVLLSSLLEQTVGWLAAGIAMSFIVGKPIPVPAQA